MLKRVVFMSAGARGLAQFIDDDQLHDGPACQHASEPLITLCFDLLIDQRGCGEADALPQTAGGDGQTGC